MGNSFVNTVKVVGDKMLEFLDGYSDLASKVDRTLESSFEMTAESVGQSVNVPKPPRYTAQDGPVISNVSTVKIDSVPVAIDTWKNVTISLSALDRNYNAKDFDAWAEKHLKPMVSPLINAVDVALFANYKKIANYVGTPGTGFGTTPATALDLMGAAREMLTYQNTPQENRSCFLNPTGTRKFTAAMGTNYNPVASVGESIKSGKAFRTEGFDMFEATNVAIHTCGTFTPNTAALTNGVDQVGSSVAIDTMTSGTFKAGDVVTFSTCYEVNPTSGKSTGTLKRWVVTADTTTGTSTTLYISPAAIPSGPFKNFTGATADLAGITDNSTVLLLTQLSSGTARSDAQQLAFWNKALGLVCVPIRAPEGLRPITRSYNGLSITLTIGADIFQYAEYFRADIAFGTTVFYPENCVRITN